MGQIPSCNFNNDKIKEEKINEIEIESELKNLN